MWHLYGGGRHLWLYICIIGTSLGSCTLRYDCVFLSLVLGSCTLSSDNISVGRVNCSVRAVYPTLKLVTWGQIPGRPLKQSTIPHIITLRTGWEFQLALGPKMIWCLVLKPNQTYFEQYYQHQTKPTSNSTISKLPHYSWSRQYECRTSHVSMKMFSDKTFGVESAYVICCRFGHFY